MGIIIYNGDKYQPWGLPLTCVGFLACVGSVVLNAAMTKAKRAAWPVVSARCTDRQLQRRTFSNGDGSTEGWLWRVVCEISYGGKPYVVTPKLQWSDTSQAEIPFKSEDEARRRIAEMISASSACKLRINPNNPHEAELLG